MAATRNTSESTLSDGPEPLLAARGEEGATRRLEPVHPAVAAEEAIDHRPAILPW